MQIGPLTTTDWPLFKAWAENEGWDTSFQEERLFLNFWQRYFYVLRHRGDCCGFISAIAYKESGWIGNLLVNPDKRHQGYGLKLMQHALDFFQQAAIDRIWLLNHNHLAPFFSKFGFTEYDHVTTWTSNGLGTLSPQPTCELDEFIALNIRCWGETQQPLHHLLEVNSIPLKSATSMALLQTGPNFWQLGPCLAETIEAQALRQLLAQARKKTPVNRPLVTHALDSAKLDLILKSSGFSTSQDRTLLYRSATRPTLHNVLALASSGSFG